MSKYIIELNEECARGFIVFGTDGDGKVICTTRYIDTLEQLTSDYINEHFSDLQDTAYQKGFEDGKVVNDKGCEGCKYSGTPQGDSPCYNCSNYYKNNWTAKDDKIEVGDTVNLKDGGRDNDGIVTKSWDNDRHFIMWADGSGGVWDKEYIVKTGRHFDIQSILEEMQK